MDAAAPVVAPAQPVPPADLQLLAERPVQLRGSRLARLVLGLLGWKLLFDGLPARQGVIVVYPHTSNWDFPIGMLAKWGLGLQATFWGKESLFKVPLFGRWLRWLGGVPVVRNAPQGVVGQMIAVMAQARAKDRFLWLALAPEGTRSRAEGWRSGFYRIAQHADVPVALVVLDYAHRQVGFDSFWRVSGHMEADFEVFAERFAHCRGLRPHLAGPVRPL